MDLFATFGVSAAGMNYERLRLDVAAVNLANAHTTHAPDGSLFKPLRVAMRPAVRQSFDEMVQAYGATGTGSALPFEATVETVDRPPRLVYEPGHPDADARGFVAYPDINPVSQMIELIAMTRAYEANVKAMNAAKTMALKALEIGGQ
jgi:flagellar basal-body rod protein FlgC